MTYVGCRTLQKTTAGSSKIKLPTDVFIYWMNATSVLIIYDIDLWRRDFESTH